MITWENFDGTKFQKFCNEFLLLEVSKHAHVYSAPGPDQGIDQLYQGTYGDKSGKWRFQDKFHSSGDAKKDWYALKRDVKHDIVKNYAGEDCLVFITNVNLSDRKKNELQAIANSAFQLMTANCEVFFWHRAFIEAIIPSHPVLYHWYWSNSPLSLQTVKTHFKSSLDQANSKRNGFQNAFIGREEELDVLNSFLKSEEQTTLAIVSNGGYGKTRLCIEFMLQIEQSESDWLPFVLGHQGYNSNEFARLLQEPKQLLILLDNANEVPDIFEDLKRQVESLNGRAKLLITTRDTLFNQTLGRLSSHNRDLTKKKLKAFSPEVTLLMLQAELPHFSHRNLLALRSLSRGVPNVILELVRAVKSGQDIAAISGDDFFAHAVLDIVSQAVNDVLQVHKISEEITIELLRLLAIISPVSNDLSTTHFFAHALSITNDKVETIINHLTDIGLIEKARTIAIKPDPYSDVILAEACKGSLRLIDRVKQLPGAEQYLENIIKNLAEAEIPTTEKQLFTQSMLHDYFELITEEGTSIQKIKRSMELAKDVSYTKPELAITAINKWIELLSDPNHAVHHEKDNNNQQKSFADTINQTVAGIFDNMFADALIKDPSRLNNLHYLLEQFIKASGYFEAIASCYGFDYWHCKCAGYRVSKCCLLQEFLKEIIVRYLATDDQFSIQFAMEAYKVLMKLEYNGTSYYDSHQMTIHYSNYSLPECAHTKKFRLELIQALTKFYHGVAITFEQRQTVLDDLSRKLFYISEASKGRTEFNVDDEIDVILDFLKELLSDKPEIWEKVKIAEVTGHWDKGKLKPAFEQAFHEIRLLSKASGSIKEELELLLRSKEYFEVRKYAGSEILRIIDAYNNDSVFLKDFIEMSADNLGLGTGFNEGLTAITESKPTLAKKLFQTVIDFYPEMIPQYSSLVRANFQDEQYFNSVIQTVFSKHPEHLSAIIWMLIYGRNGEAKYRRYEDFDFFEKAINNDDRRSIHLLDVQLIQYAFVDKSRVFKLYDAMFPKLNDQSIGQILHHIFTDPVVKRSFAVDLRGFLYNHLTLIPIDEAFGGDEVLTFLEEEFGFEGLYDFARSWTEHKVDQSPYGYFSFHDHHFRNKGDTPEDETTRFMRVIRKYLDIPTDRREAKAERQILKLFRPTSGFNNEMQQQVNILLKEIQFSEDKLWAIASALSVFPPMTEQMIRTMCLCADAYLKCTSQLATTRLVNDFFGSDFYYNTGGVRTKSGTGPFPQDVHKKQLLESVIAENTFSEPVTQFLDKCLKRVLSNIEEEINSDTRRLVWH